jgi:nucleotide-binding universal stress UspA family protein
MKIALPIDGSRYTKRMLGYVAAHDDLLGKGHEYFLFTAVPRLSSRAAAFFDRSTLDEHYASEADKVLRPARSFAERRGWTVHTAHAAGHAADEIAAFAKARRVELIVMGAHGHSALASVVLGSVTQGVLARCKLPVLLVR